MSKKVRTAKTVDAVEVLALVSSILYLQSVLTVAHHAAFRLHTIGRTVERPALAFLFSSGMFILYHWYSRGSLSKLNIVSLTILLTASIFWVSGLRANFFF